jgi:hypothetical protein
LGKTETRQLEVTQEYKEQRAKEIAEQLNDTERWHSHAFGINMQTLTNELNLKINNLEERKDLRKILLNYYHLIVDYHLKGDRIVAVHTRKSFFGG